MAPFSRVSEQTGRVMNPLEASRQSLGRVTTALTFSTTLLYKLRTDEALAKAKEARVEALAAISTLETAISMMEKEVG